MADNELVININGDASDFNKSVKGIQANLKKVAAVSGAAFVGLSAGIAATVKQFAKFDNELTAVRTLLDESSFSTKSLDEGFEDLRSGLLAVGSEFPVSIEGLNKALFDTVSAGIEASKSVEFVAVAAKLGVAGLTDVSIATDGLTTATNAFVLSADHGYGSATISQRRRLPRLPFAYARVGQLVFRDEHQPCFQGVCEGRRLASDSQRFVDSYFDR